MMFKNLIDEKYKIFAHISETDKQEKETLSEHTNLCEHYFELLMKKRGLERIFKNIVKTLIPEQNQEVELFLEEALNGVIQFHDIGKINPLFQKEIMKNDLKIVAIEGLHGKNHSFFSSYIYLDYFCDQLRNFKVEKKIKTKIKAWLFMNAYIISRHHGNLIDLNLYENEYEEQGQADILTKYLLKNKNEIYKGPFFFSEEDGDETYILLASRFYKKGSKTWQRQQWITANIYMRILYSVLLTVDYYATAEYMNGIKSDDSILTHEIEQFLKVYEETELNKKIRTYQKKEYKNKIIGKEEKDINVLRTELFLDAENKWESEKSKNIFFLEAPTGSGKSNCAMNLSFQMIKTGAKKIWYVYPYNNLLEQNYQVLKQIFDNKSELMGKIEVINSVTPIKMDKKVFDTQQENEDSCYQKALLDRQFLSTPFLLTTHVNFFNILFGTQKESAFGFWNLADSVVVLDEIQSYRNEIWSEIMIFLEQFAEILKIKIIIMSATLPKLEILTGTKENILYLIEDRNKYYSHPLFKDRVQISYELLDRQLSKEELCEHIVKNTKGKQKVLIEFIKKDSAYQFYKIAKDRLEKFEKIYCLTGDDNILERKKILSQILQKNNAPILLIATQVIEAGVDIDMDIGYKDISMLDSEEQFMGRINRSCKRRGKTYFFQMDNSKKIYKNDIRINTEFTLKEPDMRKILEDKNFERYYKAIFKVLKEYNKISSESNLENFFAEDVKYHSFKNIEKRMTLIEENQWRMSVFIARKIILENGTLIDGLECWQEYLDLLTKKDLSYAKRKILLSEIKSKMSYFIYEIKKNLNLTYSDKIGDLYLIEDGDKYFLDGKLNREKLEENVSYFIE